MRHAPDTAMPLVPPPAPQRGAQPSGSPPSAPPFTFPTGAPGPVVQPAPTASALAREIARHHADLLAEAVLPALALSRADEPYGRHTPRRPPPPEPGWDTSAPR
ncbi:hypothetical protein OHS33_31290 [Streptomyces sp. NBC_00536]|uniref:hypothetical protein n=1 Tax=Streptomyces sp. NBC_00536 TaxID=2975769 RepID=UPI002E807FAE|nr:hypothetical protein [Streptomyces sp. NBC_00536]WUC82446.1 hypothetical protein OHS33_31290 [Streptomyces sp. NBC_00536]